MQHLRVNFEGIWRFELGFFIFFLLKKSGFLKVQWQHYTPPTGSGGYRGGGREHASLEAHVR